MDQLLNSDIYGCKPFVRTVPRADLNSWIKNSEREDTI